MAPGNEHDLSSLRQRKSSDRGPGYWKYGIPLARRRRFLLEPRPHFALGRRDCIGEWAFLRRQLPPGGIGGRRCPGKRGVFLSIRVGGRHGHERPGYADGPRTIAGAPVDPVLTTARDPESPVVKNAPHVRRDIQRPESSNPAAAEADNLPSDVEELGDRIPPRLARLQSIDPGRVLGPQTIDLLPDDDEPGRRRLLDIQVARSVECELEAGQVRDRRCTEHAAVIDRPGGSPSLHRIENLKTTVAHRDIARGAVLAGALSHLADRLDRAGREVGDEYRRHRGLGDGDTAVAKLREVSRALELPERRTRGINDDLGAGRIAVVGGVSGTRDRQAGDREQAFAHGIAPRRGGRGFG